MAKNNAAVFDEKLLITAGIDPQIVLRLKGAMTEGTPLKDSIVRLLGIVDQQDACNRFTWTNIPAELSSQELERMLYLKGNLALFYEKTTQKFYILPYALDGTIDVYGRFNKIHPVPFGAGQDVDEKQETMADILSKKSYNVIKDVVLPEELISDPRRYMEDSAVILYDYNPQLSPNITPRSQLDKDLLCAMGDCIPFMRTALMNSTGVRGVRTTADASPEITLAAQTVYSAALNGKPYIPFQSNLEFQELTSGIAIRAEEYLIALQSLDNFRLSLHGISTGGLFQKKSHMLEAEQNMNAGKSSLVMADSLGVRHRACLIANSIWGIGMWCSASEEALGADRDGDGIVETNNGAEQEAEYADQSIQ